MHFVVTFSRQIAPGIQRPPTPTRSDPTDASAKAKRLMTSEPAFDAPTKRPYACNICGKRFSKTNVRDRHEREQHIEGDVERDWAKKVKLSREYHQRRKDVMMERLRQLEGKKKTLHDGHEEIDRQMANVQMLIQEINNALREENSIPNIGSDEFDPDPMPDFQNLDQRDLTMGGLLAVEFMNSQRRQHLGVTEDKTIQFKFTDKARSLCTTQRRAKTLLWEVLSFVTQHIPDYKTPCFVQTSIGSADSTLDFEICSTLQDNIQTRIYLSDSSSCLLKSHKLRNRFFRAANPSNKRRIIG